MKEDLFARFQSEQEEEAPPQRQLPRQDHLAVEQEATQERESFLDPPRELPKRSYSLEPDMANGWRPKRTSKFNPNSVFSLNYDQEAVDQLVRTLYRTKAKHNESLAYLGPRRNNSFAVHQGNAYPNPYPPDRHLDQHFSARNGLPLAATVQEGRLRFSSDFQGGNLDVAIDRGSGEYDLFMRVDSNTRGHTNWFHFSIANGEFLGRATLNICNFRREKSLYQRGLRPYVRGRAQEEWQQGGQLVRYERTRLRYSFLDEEEGEEAYELQDQAHA